MQTNICRLFSNHCTVRTTQIPSSNHWRSNLRRTSYNSKQTVPYLHKSMLSQFDTINKSLIHILPLSNLSVIKLQMQSNANSSSSQSHPERHDETDHRRSRACSQIDGLHHRGTTRPEDSEPRQQRPEPAAEFLRFARIGV